MFALLRSLRANISSRRPKATPRPKKTRVQLSVEQLEDRLVPAFLGVTNALDVVGTPGTLRDAVNQANADAAQGIADTISFASSLNGARILLQQGPLELTAGASAEVSIWGSGITLSGDGTNIFQVDSGAQLYLNGLTLSGGDAVNGNGGAIDNAGVLTVYACTIANNEATGSGSMGGGIYNTGTLLVPSASTFISNTATFGGAIANGLGGTVSLLNSTLSSNSATDGGAIYNDGFMTVNGTTLSGNTVQKTEARSITTRMAQSR
jgi:hypothetical protein